MQACGHKGESKAINSFVLSMTHVGPLEEILYRIIALEPSPETNHVKNPVLPCRSVDDKEWGLWILFYASLTLIMGGYQLNPPP